MTLAYPGERSKLSEHLASDSFLIALDDFEMESKVREREPKDLESAMKLAQRFEVFKGAVEATSFSSRRYNRAVTEENCNSQRVAVARSGGSCESYHVTSNRRHGCNRNRQVSNQVGTNEDQEWKHDTTRRIDHLQQAHDKSLSENKKIAAENAESIRSRSITTSRTIAVIGYSARYTELMAATETTARRLIVGQRTELFNYGDLSHFARNYPVRQQTRQCWH
jgi:hypothetical protein